ncbi:MAG: SIS domain-containing protein [Rhodothermales bacterium]
MDTLTDTGTIAQMRRQLAEARRVQEAVQELVPALAALAEHIADAYRNQRQVIFFGNGGSAAAAQHWAAELSGRLYMDRSTLPALALTTNTSQLTAIANDYGYDEVFARPLSGLARPGDVAVGISTSGRSVNVLRGLEAARQRGALTVGFTGASGDAMAPLCDYLIRIPSDDVARIQEGHELCGHLIWAAVEELLFGEQT